MIRNHFIQEIARGAGRIVLEGYKNIQTCRAKVDPGDVVTEIDEASEKYVIDRIKSEYPNEAILSEESGAIGYESGEGIWIIDPLDGTRNYTQHVPFFCVSIAYCIGGAAQLGAIYDPVHDEMFFAEKGKGTFLNGGLIVVSKEESVEDGLINVSWARGKGDSEQFINYLDNLSEHTSYFRRLGSAALVMAYVASGRLQGYVQSGVNPWDVAAGVVIIEEAGGNVTDFQGNPMDYHKKNIEVIAGNPAIHRDLVELMRRASS